MASAPDGWVRMARQRRDAVTGQRIAVRGDAEGNEPLQKLTPIPPCAMRPASGSPSCGTMTASVTLSTRT